MALKEPAMMLFTVTMMLSFQSFLIAGKCAGETISLSNASMLTFWAQ